MFRYIKKYLRRFWKYFIIESEKYARWEHGRYDNGYFCHEPKALEINCCCCKTDFQKHEWGLSYRCVYPEFVSEPLGIIEPKGIDSLLPVDYKGGQK